jgi:hypothetical protein
VVCVFGSSFWRFVVFFFLVGIVFTHKNNMNLNLTRIHITEDGKVLGNMSLGVMGTGRRPSQDNTPRTARLIEAGNGAGMSITARTSRVVTTLRSRVQGLTVDDGTIVELRKSVLAGGFNALPSSSLWRPPNWKVAIYVSSADTDCQREREMLAQLLPLKKAKFAESGIDVEMVDMRSGFKFDGEWDVDCWKYRRAAMERCREESQGLCFITLQSNK